MRHVCLATGFSNYLFVGASVVASMGKLKVFAVGLKNSFVFP